MHALDYLLIVVYFGFVLGVGYYFYRRQKSVDEYFVGDRKLGALHTSLSVVATDVGGGFSIGLGGLGFVMGLSGSWLLFTGLLGAWLTAVIVVPRIKPLGDKHRMLTFPDFLRLRFDAKTGTAAAIFSGLGYAGFVGSQILAGAKLTTAVLDINLATAVWIMAAVVILYTSFGGLQAVVYTDFIQWIVLLSGLLFVALPFAYVNAGGWHEIKAALPPGHLDIFNISWVTFLTWLATIVPIWFVAMTIYQRLFAVKDVKTAKRAWFLAGILEWPIFAFVGVALGALARISFPEAEQETALLHLIKDVLPTGVLGIVMAAYFSAIMSTADSCLLASTGHFVNDIYQRHINPKATEKRVLMVSRLVSVALGLSAVVVAFKIPLVLDSIMLSYKVIVSGLFLPTLAGLFWPRVSARAAFLSMVLGGGAVIFFSVFPAANPLPQPIFTALLVSALTLLLGAAIWPRDRKTPLEQTIAR